MNRPALITLFGLLAACVARAAMYLYIPDIPGESTEKTHADWIDLTSVSSLVWTENYFASGFRESSIPHFGDLEVTKKIDKSTPALLRACARGDHLHDLVLVVTRSGQGGVLYKYFEYQLREALVSTYSTNTSPLGEILETFSFNYSRIDWYYWQLNEDGSVGSQAEAWWDVRTNTGDGNSGGSSGGGGSGTTNLTPSIQYIPNQVLQPGETRMVDVIVSDGDDPVDSLVVTATTTRPDLIKNLIVGGTGSNRTLTFTASSLYSGLAGITVRASDGKATRSLSFTALIDVEATPFEAFMAAYFTQEELDDPILSSPVSDPDEDDMATIMEFGLGTNPREYTQPQEAVRVTRENTPSGPVIRLRFLRVKDAGTVGPIPWMAPESLVYEPLDAGNPNYEEITTESINPLYEDVSGTLQVDENENLYLIRMQIRME